MEDMFQHSLAVILHDDMLKVFVGKGCIGENNGVVNGLGNCSGHDDVGLAGFVMEEFSHRRDQEAKKLFGGIIMV